MGDHEGVFTLATPPGARRNCTVTTLLFPGNFQILESTMAGVRSGEEGPDAPVSDRQPQGGGGKTKAYSLENSRDLLDSTDNLSCTLGQVFGPI